MKEIQRKRKGETFSSEKWKNEKTLKNQKMKKWTKNEKKKKNNKKKDKKNGRKKVGKKGKEGLKGHPPPEMGPKIDVSHKNCQEKS